jgi:uncharacterized membrane protein
MRWILVMKNKLPAVVRKLTRLTHASPDIPALGIALLAVLWCVALWATRAWFTGSDNLFFLVYNLALAAIPLALGTVAIRLGKQHSKSASLLVLMWLALFPNAPYLLTDLIHLRLRPESPFWFDWLLFVSMAGAGLLIGLVSLAQVNRYLRDRFSILTADGLIVGVVAMSAFGIYLGRFLRWNSWDIATRPGHLLSELVSMLVHPFDHPRMLAYSFGVSVILGLSYFGPMAILRTLQHRDQRQCPASVNTKRGDPSRPPLGSVVEG